MSQRVSIFIAYLAEQLHSVGSAVVANVACKVLAHKEPAIAWVA